jgi:hypothetical protein
VSAQDQVAALIAAKRVLDKPSRYRVTDAEIRAMAGTCVALAGLADRLAAAIEGVMDADEALERCKAELVAIGPEGEGFGIVRARLPDLLDAHIGALKTLRTTYEQEFPHGQD